ncbi:laminin-like protein epi-1 isoform X3 [Amblyomma americanum]
MTSIDRYIAVLSLCLSAARFQAANIPRNEILRARTAVARDTKCAGCKCPKGEDVCNIPSTICECYEGAIYFQNTIYCAKDASDCRTRFGNNENCIPCECSGRNCKKGKCECEDGNLLIWDIDMKRCAHSKSECAASTHNRFGYNENCIPCECNGRNCKNGKCECEDGNLLIWDDDMRRCARSKSECAASTHNRFGYNENCIPCECSGRNCKKGKCECEDGNLLIWDVDMRRCARSKSECAASTHKRFGNNENCIPCECNGRSCKNGKCECEDGNLMIWDVDMRRCARSKSECAASANDRSRWPALDTDSR